MMSPKLIIMAVSAIFLVSMPSCTTAKPHSIANSPATASIKIGGSSSTVGFVDLMKSHYVAHAKNVTVTPLKPGQSEGVIEAIKLGVVDVGAISTKIKENSQLEHQTIAQDLLLVATHSSVTGVKNLTTKNLQDIYSGNITNWQALGGPNAKIVLLDRPEDESAKKLLRKFYLGNDLKNSVTAVVLRKEGDLIKTLQSNPYSIGAFSLAHAITHKLPVNHLSLNGYAPNIKNFRIGKYPMVRQISLVWNKKPSAVTQDFMKYAFSSAASTALQEAGFIPEISSQLN